MTVTEALSKIELLESALLQTVQELRAVKAEIQKQTNGATLEPLLEPEQVAEILGVDVIDDRYRIKHFLATLLAEVF